MALFDVSLLARDIDFMNRIAACASIEGKSANGMDWAITNMWTIAASPTFGEKYAYALAANVPNPGRDETVISDAEILSAVQPIT